MEFTVTDAGRKVFKYARQMTELVHRDQTAMYIDLSDLDDYDSTLAARVTRNTKRYLSFFYEIVQELLPDYKEKEVTAKDALGKIYCLSCIKVPFFF